MNSNSTPYIKFGTDDGEVTDAPDFVNEGTDYTPAVSSPLKNAGADFSTLPWGITITGSQTHIGAVGPVVSGGGLLMPNKTGNKQ